MKFALSKYLVGLASAVVLFSMAGCSGDPKKPAYDFFHHMNDTPAVKAQRVDSFGVAGRVAPEDTIHQESAPYRYANDAEGAARNLKNPLPRTKAVLVQGQKLYNNTCVVCHGKIGDGNGSVVPKFPMPPTLHSEKVRGWSDGAIFHVATVGQNVMSGYASQLNAEERWAVVHYVRVLQRAYNPTEQDVREFSKEGGK